MDLIDKLWMTAVHKQLLEQPDLLFRNLQYLHSARQVACRLQFKKDGYTLSFERLLSGIMPGLGGFNPQMWLAR